MLERIHGGLTRVDSLIHQKGLRKELISEIKDCFEYFDKETSVHGQNTRATLIHGNRIELRRLPGEKSGYEVDLFVPLTAYREVLRIKHNRVSKVRISHMDGSVVPVYQSTMTREEVEAIIRKIHRITLPYLEHVLKKRHLSSAETSLSS